MITILVDVVVFVLVWGSITVLLLLVLAVSDEYWSGFFVTPQHPAVSSIESETLVDRGDLQ